MRDASHLLRKFLRSVVLALAIISCCALAACSSVEPQGGALEVQLPPYSVRVLPESTPTFSADGYDATLRFRLTSTEPFPMRHLVQEIHQLVEIRRPDGKRAQEIYTLVEAFELTSHEVMGDGSHRYTLHPLQRDRHYEAGYNHNHEPGTLVMTTRRVTLYPANVKDQDATWLGFAHLPANRDGSVKTRVGANFNRRYQQRHRTQGVIVADDRRNARHYTLRYRWELQAQGKVKASFMLDMDPDLREDSIPTIDPELPPPSFAVGDHPSDEAEAGSPSSSDATVNDARE